MRDTCIICGKPAGTREHLFPAALGGRRVDKGIYCPVHNHGFSGLVGIITEQLRVINSLLGVKHDRTKRSDPLAYESPDGEKLVIHNGRVRSADPATAQSGQPHRISLALGGAEGLRTIGYIALTFFAHHFPEPVRRPELRPFKDFVLGHGDNAFVWWESAAVAGSLPENPFEFGHTIVLRIAPDTGEVAAFISLFQSLHYGMLLGRLSGVAESTVTIFIDPHAPRAPADTIVMREPIAGFRLEKPDPLQAYLERAVHDGSGERQLQDLAEKIERWAFRKETQPVLERLNAARTLPAEARAKEIRAAVEGEAPRVFRLMEFVVNEMSSRIAANPAQRAVIPVLRKMIEIDPAKSSGLSDLTLLVWNHAVNAILDVVGKELSTNDVTRVRTH